MLLIAGNSEVLHRVVEKLPHYETVHCGNISKALLLLSEHSFDAILADMDLAPLTDFLSLDEHLTTTPLIALTSSPEFVWNRAADSIAKDEMGWAILPRVVNCAIRCRRANETTRDANQLTRALFDDSPVAISVVDASGIIVRWNKAAEQTFGWPESEVIGKFLPTIPPDEREAYLAKLGRFISGLERSNGEDLHCLRRDGSIIDVNVWKELLHDANGGVSGIMSLIFDSSEKLKLEQQLRQAQRLEAVGQLAGGVAHDFNNLLTIISGYSDLALSQLSPQEPLRYNVEQVLKAANRATALTSQLLAFSRKQVLKPIVLDLNEIIADLEKMLRRLIGENIDLITILETDLGCVKADPGQIEQVIVNLAVNSRDAMPDGGKLIIETSNVELDAHYTSQHIGTLPGPYVMISVSDSGHGIGPETQSHIFEPFFTTREHGKGTGLGLSMVYGIVKQSGGNIWVYSEPGHGTTFKIYFPLVLQPSEPIRPIPARAAPGRGVETILLVEDEERVRELVKEVLIKQGYTVITARDGKDALGAAAREARQIDLLLTDVVMPKMSGRELAEILVPMRPSLKVLYMSGYTDNAMLHKGTLDSETKFIQKPFTPDALARKVREVLDAKGAGIPCPPG